MGIKSYLKTGNIINKEFAYYEVPFKLDIFDQETYSKSKTDFYATITNVETGKAEYVKLESVLEQMEILRATSAMPFVSKMVELKLHIYEKHEFDNYMQAAKELLNVECKTETPHSA